MFAQNEFFRLRSRFIFREIITPQRKSVPSVFWLITLDFVEAQAAVSFWTKEQMRFRVCASSAVVILTRSLTNLKNLIVLFNSLAVGLRDGSLGGDGSDVVWKSLISFSVVTSFRWVETIKQMIWEIVSIIWSEATEVEIAIISLRLCSDS